MGKLWGSAVGWFQGKKTILGGGLVMAAAVAGVWFGKIDAVSAAGLFGLGFSITGFANKANRHQAELLTALQGVAQIGADARAGKPVAGDASNVAAQSAPAVRQLLDRITNVQIANDGATTTYTVLQPGAPYIEPMAPAPEGPVK